MDIRKTDYHSDSDIQVRGYNPNYEKFDDYSCYWVESSKNFSLYKTETMAAKKVNDKKIIVVEGDYFSATYEKKKIRGVVEVNYKYFYLLNSTCGEELSDEHSFKYGIDLECECLGTEADLKKAGVTNYVVLKDKRQKALVARDERPELCVGQSGGCHRVSIKGNTFTFGCGAVQLTRAEIEGWMRWRNKYNETEMEDIGKEALENLSEAEVKRWFAWKKENGTSPDYKMYIKVMDKCRGQEDKDDILEIEDDDVKALFKYADHVNSGV